MKYQGVIFDFNGTLFYDTPFHNIAWQRVVKEITGKDIDQDLKIKMHGKNNKEIIRCIQSDMNDQDNEYYSKHKEELYRNICLENPEQLHLVKGAISFFEYLKRNNIPFTIASASIKENIDFFVEIFELDKWFDVGKIIYDDGKYIDKIEMFNDASKLLNVNIDECIIFEDSSSGIGYAKDVNSGLVVGVGNDAARLMDYGADMCITNFDEFDGDKYL